MLIDGLETMETRSAMLRRINRSLTSCRKIANARLTRLDRANRIPTSTIRMGDLVSIS